MRLATLINSPDDGDLVRDTLDSVLHHWTKHVLVTVDGACPHDPRLPVPHLKGFYCKSNRAPFRNVALGLECLLGLYEADWYCYMDYDCLVASDRVMGMLRSASGADLHMLGNDGKLEHRYVPFVEEFVGHQPQQAYYLLGCCLFFSKKYMTRLKECDFFQRFLIRTNGLDAGSLPGYRGHDISEHLYPTLARAWGMRIGVLASWQGGVWHGSSAYYPMRFRPVLDAGEIGEDVCVMHPVKEVNSPIREKYREKRCMSRLQPGS